MIQQLAKYFVIIVMTVLIIKEIMKKIKGDENAKRRKRSNGSRSRDNP